MCRSKVLKKRWGRLNKLPPERLLEVGFDLRCSVCADGECVCERSGRMKNTLEMKQLHGPNRFRSLIVCIPFG